MDTADNTTWIARDDDGVVVARVRSGELLVDRPSAGTYREPRRAGPGAPVVDGVELRPVAPLPERLDRLAGWYDGAGRRLLLTQIPEAYFGEPMVLVAEGDEVVRAYPLDDDHLLTEQGALVDLSRPGQLRVTTGAAVAELDRSPDYREQEVTFGVGDVQLAGTVVLPPGPGPHPAAVLLHGAAGGQRDFCRLHAGPVLAAGVAVLLYDKAGHGRSGGVEPTIFDQADAAEAALRALAELPDVDADRVGLAGFSNGMWAVPMAAARRGAAFVAGVGSPGVSMAESEVHRRTKVLREAGVGPATVAAAGEAWRCLFTVAGEGPSPSVAERLREALAVIATADDVDRYEVPDFVRQNPMLSPLPPPGTAEDLLAMVGGSRDPELTYDPATDYARLHCPVFLQYGADDTSVPVEVSVERIRSACAGAGREPDVRVYPGLEHLLNVLPTDVTGLSPEDAMYQYHRFRYGAGVWDDLTAWLSETVVGSAVGASSPG